MRRRNERTENCTFRNGHISPLFWKKNEKKAGSKWAIYVWKELNWKLNERERERRCLMCENNDDGLDWIDRENESGMVNNLIAHPHVVRLRRTEKHQHALSPLLDELEPYKHHHATRVWHVRIRLVVGKKNEHFSCENYFVFRLKVRAMPLQNVLWDLCK